MDERVYDPHVLYFWYPGDLIYDTNHKEEGSILNLGLLTLSSSGYKYDE